MLLNRKKGEDQSQNLELRLCCMLNFIKRNFMSSKQASQYSNGFQLYPGAEAYVESAAHDSSGLRSHCSHSCTVELQITVDRSICLNFVRCLDSCFSVTQELKVVQGTLKVPSRYPQGTLKVPSRYHII